MTLGEVNHILAQPLKFGDPLQVNARKFVAAVDKAKAAILRCRWTHKQIASHPTPFDLERQLTACECVEGFHEDERLEAAKLLIKEWKHD